ncbi:MAG: alginate export family protein [Robiginitomaculum sp.]
MRAFLIATTTILAVSAPAFADEAASFTDALTNGKASVNFRYRIETVDQANMSNDALASTLRTKLKYETGLFKGFSGVLEFDAVGLIGNDEYNSTINGVTNRPVVADPAMAAVNQAYIAYTGIENTTALIGRKALNMDNQRFIGTVGWRQNDQSYDMAAVITKPSKDFTVTAGYVWNVNRIFGDEHAFGDLDTDSFVLNGKYSGLELGNLTGYALLIDLNDSALYGLSTQTYGLRFDGKHKMSADLTALYEAEFAAQSEHGESPLSFSANYSHLAAGLSANGLTGKLGYEVLGSDGGAVAFQTPLATLHKFNGWADKFLGTPAGGLQNIYGSVSYKIKMDGVLSGVKLDAVYHDFSADIGGADYGSEVDLQVSKKFGKNYYGALKFADYNADSFSTDTQKTWLTIGANY